MNAKNVTHEMDEKEYEDFLNESEPEVTIFGISYSAGMVLREVNPIAFHCAMLDYNDMIAKDIPQWECGDCGNVHRWEGYAEDCCK